MRKQIGVLVPILTLLVFVDTFARADRQPNPSSTSAMVNTLYHAILERDPDTPGQASWIQAIDKGFMTVRQVHEGIVLSDEHQRRFVYQPLVLAVYKQVLQREADASGLQANIDAFANGHQNVRQMVLSLSTSPEFLESTRNSKPNDVIRLLYSRILGRENPPSQEEVDQQFKALMSIGYTQLAKSFTDSAEYAQRWHDWGIPGDSTVAKDIVNILYRHILGRPAEAGPTNTNIAGATQNGYVQTIKDMFRSHERMRYSDWEFPGDSIVWMTPRVRQPTVQPPQAPSNNSNPIWAAHVAQGAYLQRTVDGLIWFRPVNGLTVDKNLVALTAHQVVSIQSGPSALWFGARVDTFWIYYNDH